MDDEKSRTLEEFTKQLAEELQVTMDARFGIHVDPELTKTLKTNGERNAITIHFEDSNIAPTIYPDKLLESFEAGKTIREIAEETSDYVYAAHMDSPRIPTLTSEEALKHITLTLVNTRMNQQLLEKVPHFEILDGELSAIPRWYISDEMSFVVTNDHCSMMELTPDEVLQMGQQHINEQTYTIRTMQEVLSEMMGGMEEMFPPMEDTPPMLVVTSESKLQGSNALLSDETLDRVHDMIGDCVVLPSSVHEVLCLPITEEMDPEELRCMVRTVNLEQVSEDERLSDQIMKYDGRSLSLVGDSFVMETPEMAAPEMESHSMKFAM